MMYNELRGFVLFVLSQIIVVIADCLFVCSMLSKSKLKLTIFLLGSDIMFALHYLCLGALSGFIILCIDAAFLVVAFLLQHFNKDEFLPIVGLIAISLIITSGILTWAGAISLLPVFAISTYMASMMFKNLIVVKIGTTIRNILNVIYIFLLGSFIGAILEFCLLINSIFGTILTVKQYKNDNILQKTDKN